MNDDDLVVSHCAPVFLDIGFGVFYACLRMSHYQRNVSSKFHTSPGNLFIWSGSGALRDPDQAETREHL